MVDVNRDPIAEFEAAFEAKDEPKLRALLQEALGRLAQVVLSFDNEKEVQIDSLQAEIARLRAALKPFAELEWVEEYTMATPNVRTFVPRWAIENARKVLGEGD